MSRRRFVASAAAALLLTGTLAVAQSQDVTLTLSRSTAEELHVALGKALGTSTTTTAAPTTTTTAAPTTTTTAAPTTTTAAQTTTTATTLPPTTTTTIAATTTTTAPTTTTTGVPAAWPEAPRNVISEPFPTPDVVLQPGANVQASLAVNRIVELAPGNYGNQQINPPSGSYIFSRGVAVFDGGAPSTVRKFVNNNGGNDVTFRGLEIRRYRSGVPSGSGSAAVIDLPSGAQGWRFIDVEVWNFDSSAFDFSAGNTRRHHLINVEVHDGARYAFHGSNHVTIQGGSVYRMCLDDGTQLVPKAADSNRGWSKFSAGSTGMLIVQDHYLHDIDGKGIWLDGSRGGATIQRVRAVNVRRAPILMEIAWGPFLIEDIEVVNSAEGISTPNTWPSFAAVEISLSPDATIRRIKARGVSTGIGLLQDGNHPVLTGGILGGSIPASEVRPHLGLARIDISDLDIEASRYAIGLAGDAPNRYSDLQRTSIRIHGILRFEPDARFRIGGQVGITWEQFRQGGAGIVVVS